MRAFVCSENGPPTSLSLVDLQRDDLGDNDVRIEVHYFGVNFADVMAVAGVHQFPPPKPFSPGFEAAGIVREAGENATQFAPGDRVMFTDGYGAYREEVVCDTRRVFHVPDSLTLSQAAAFPVAFGTPYFALVRRARLRHGDTLLVIGAAGNIGSAAVQIGKLLGARVLAVVGTRSIAEAKALGADVVIDYTSENVALRVKEETCGRGADIVFDPVVGPEFQALKTAVAPEGVYLLMGLAGGDLSNVPTLTAIEPLQINIGFLSADYDFYVHADIEAVRRCFDVLFGWVAQGWITPLSSTLSRFEDTVSVLSAVAEKSVSGKQVLMTQFASDSFERSIVRAV